MYPSKGEWSILLVDDDDTTNFLNNLLIKEVHPSIKIHTESGAVAALRYLNSLSENAITKQKLLVFFDINMPEMDGFEFLDAYEKGDRPQIETTIIMLTSSINRRDIDRAKEHQLYDIIEKPLTPEKLKTIFSDLGI